MLKHLFFDLDDTILDFHKAEAIALRKALSLHGLEPTPEVVARYSIINQSQWELLEEKKITRPQVLLRRFELLFGEFGLSCDCCAIQRSYETLLGQGHYFMPGAEALLDTLYGKYHLYLVSNGTLSVQTGRIESAQIARYFDGIFISENLGVDKPQKGFFDLCFAEIPDFRVEEGVIIGDSLTSDIRGGNNAGLRTIWMNPQGKPRREDIHVDYEITALSQLPALFEAMG